MIEECYEKMNLPRLNTRQRVILYVFTLIIAAVTILQLIFELFAEEVSYILYIVSAISLTFAVIYIIGDIRHIRVRVNNMIGSNSFTKRFTTDYRYRTLLTSVPSFVLNVFFALFNGIIGIISRSVWYGAMAAYYLLLCAMRWGAMLHIRLTFIKKEETPLKREISTYRHSGELLMVLSLALGVIVVLMLRGNGSKTYPGYLIYVVAAYTFWKVIMSAVNLAKSRKTSSPLLITLRNIGHADALVSILSLETAMLSSFGTKSGEKFTKIILSATGIMVCTAVLVIGLTMVIGAVLRKKKLDDCENG